MISESRIEVTFPDDRTHTARLDGQGRIQWSNDSTWEVPEFGFGGPWRVQGQPGPLIIQVGDALDVDMKRYGRPAARGRVTGPATAVVGFPDDATHTATLVGPACMQWSNGSVWTR